MRSDAATQVGKHMSGLAVHSITLSARCSTKRSAALPDVPTVAEAGISGAELNEWQGIVVPAGTPKAVIDILHRETVAVLGLADVRERIAGLGAEVAASTPEQFAEHIRKELAIWGKVIKQSGIQAN